MKKNLLLVVLLALGGISAKAQTLIDVQFGGNDYGSPAVAQTGAGFIGSSGDQWNNFTSDSALLAGVSLLNSAGASTGASLKVTGSSGIYQYATGVASTPGDPYAANQLSSSGNALGNLASGELGDGTALTLSFTGLTANTNYSLYLLSAPDRWERSSSWSVNGGTAQTVGPLNSYTGPYSYNPNGYGGWNPYTTVQGINYLLLTGTTDSSGNLTLAGTSVSGDVDINGFQLQAAAVSVPEPSSYALMLGGLLILVALRRKSGFRA